MDGRIRERRAHPRRHVQLAVHVETWAEDHPIECETIDLSLGGTRLRSPERLPIGRTVLVFVTGHDELLVVGGEVLDEKIDASEGVVEARIRFREMRETARSRLASVLETIDLAE